MSTPALTEYLIIRDLDEPVSAETFDAVAAESIEAAAALREEGVRIRWVTSDVRTRTDGDIVGTVCHYRAEDEAAIRAHADRAGLPVTSIDIHGATRAHESHSPR